MPKKHLPTPANKSKRSEVSNMALHHEKNRRSIVLKFKVTPIGTISDSKKRNIVTVLGDKVLELTPLVEIEPIVSGATLSKNSFDVDKKRIKGKKANKFSKKKIDYTPLSEINPVVCSATIIKKRGKSKITKFREIFTDIWSD
jgi:hypothetical protein